MNKKHLESLIWALHIHWKSSKVIFVWEIINGFVSGLMPLFLTYATAKLISSASASISNGQSSSEVYFWLFAILLYELFNLLIQELNSFANSISYRKFEITSNQIFLDKMYSLSHEQFEDQQFQTQIERAKDGIYSIKSLFNEINWSIGNMISFVGSLVIFASISIWIPILILVVLAPKIVIEYILNKKTEKIYRYLEPYERISFRSKYVLFDPSSMLEIRLMGAIRDLVKSWKGNFEYTNDIQQKHEKKRLLIDNFSSSLGIFTFFGINIHFFQLAVAGNINLERLIFLRGILENSSGSLIRTVNSFQNLHRKLIDISNISEFYTAKPIIQDGDITIDRPLKIEFQDVSFRYPNSKKYVLKKVNLVINPGEKLALVGENGSGKSTLIKLLLRIYLPTSGKILINSVDISKLKSDVYYSLISNLSQEFLLVTHLSIRENLQLGLKNKFTDKELYRITDLVDATDFIKKLPAKLDSKLDTSFENGSNLSGGQKQRLCVARVLLRYGDLLILDEPTSAIDAKAEFNIFNNIFNFHSSNSTLIVSHRFSTVRKANKILVLDKGCIIEQGSHEELIKLGGTYRNMFNIQAEGYK